MIRQPQAAAALRPPGCQMFPDDLPNHIVTPAGQTFENGSSAGAGEYASGSSR
ncbi:MAG: hypothetical protein QOG83_3442 [Alphaproteobacteria bacterium]|nr:hypothetical protein [Alphaproteobacteria bacterium]